jgi:DNA repair protein RecO (recombination protein O)
MIHRIELQPAYILHSRPYRETSLLLEVFTADYGRIGVVAKGIRRSKTKLRGLLQPFVPLLISCSGNGELCTLKDFDVAGMVVLLHGRALVSAFYLNELLMRLLHRWEEQKFLFQSYNKALNELKIKKEQIVLRLFEKSLLKALGYELQLVKEVETGCVIDPEKFYAFDPERGPILITSPHKPQAHCLRLQRSSENERQRLGNLYNQYLGNMKTLFKGRSLLALHQEELHEEDGSVLWDAKRLMRGALAVHLGNKPLESRKLL